MNKRSIMLILFVLVFLASIGVGYFYLHTRNDQKKSAKVEENITNPKTITNEYITTDQSEEKVSPNANLVATIYYGKCGHSKIDIEEVPREVVNLSEDEFKERFDDWKVDFFSEKQISISKEVANICPDHYIVGSADGIVNIYKMNEEGEEELYETTNIYLEYLPEEDQQKIKKKIEVIGRENLNALLENYD